MTARIGADGLIQFDHASHHAAGTSGIEFFEFGAFGLPKSAVDANSITDYLGLFLTEQEYYVPPVSMKGLIQLMKANPHHGTLPSFKANLLVKYLEETVVISRAELKRAGIDYGATGNCYFQAITNGAGQIIRLKHLPAVVMRAKPDGRYCMILKDGKLLDFADGEVIHLMDYDPMQQIYGIPYWFGAVQSILMGEDARLLPRRFFLNGLHAGNLIVTSGLLPSEEAFLKQKLASTHGIGNFRSSHIGLPTGDVDKVLKIIPIGEIGNKIEFTKFANQSASDILEAWRIRPELAGMMPENISGSGDLAKIMELNYEYEIIPFQQEFQQINDYLPARYHLKFKEWKRPT